MSKTDRHFEDAAQDASLTFAIRPARRGAAEPPSLAEALREAQVGSVAGQPANFAALEIGERIRMARQTVGLTQAELARRTGCNQGDLSDIERGKGRDGPSYKTLKAIAVALGAELPVNPVPEAPSILRVSEASSGVSINATGYDKVYPLYADHEWRHIGKRVKARLKMLPALDIVMAQHHLTTCQIVSVGPSQRAHFRCDDGHFLIGMIRGKGGVHVSKPFYRFHSSEPASAVAIMNEQSEVVVKTADDESCVFMAVPASVLVARNDEADFS